MPLNSLLPAGAVAPRLRVTLNGSPIPGALGASVHSTNNFHADRFTVRFAPPVGGSGVGSWQWWSDQTSLLLDVQLGLMSPDGATTWASMVYGQVDTIDLDRTGYQVTIDGRDLTARFIDNKTDAAYPNQTASQIIAALAAKEGLQTQITATTVIVGRYYADEHDHIAEGQFSRPRPEWDLMTMLARFEGFDIFVKGQTLYFQPATPPDSNPYLVRHAVDQFGRQTGNALTLQLRRSLTVAKGISVVVKSWHAAQARAFTRSAPASKAASPSRTVDIQQYVFVRPNLTEDQAQQMANTLYQQISQHERTVSGTLPGDMILTPRVLLRVEGTGTAFDQVYYPDDVTREISVDQGFVMHFRAKNLPPSVDTTG